jgi:hypothetical protein
MVALPVRLLFVLARLSICHDFSHDHDTTSSCCCNKTWNFCFDRIARNCEWSKSCRGHICCFPRNPVWPFVPTLRMIWNLLGKKPTKMMSTMTLTISGPFSKLSNPPWSFSFYPNQKTNKNSLMTPIRAFIELRD